MENRKHFSEFTTSPTLRCPCNNSFRERIIEYTSPPNGEILKVKGSDEYWRAYDECSLCKHFFEVHDFDMKAYYEGEYVKSTYGGIERLHQTFQRVINLPAAQSDNAQRVKRINKKVTRYFKIDELALSELTLLDVGSGTGVFPYAMKAWGWKSTALDPDPIACEHIQKMLNINVICTDYLKVDSAYLGQYDLITFNKVLEHVDDPIEFLMKSRQVLRPNGIIYIEVPDVGALNDYEREHREEFHLGHLHVFSPGSLYKIIETSGLNLLEIMRLKDPSGKYTLAAFCRSNKN